ncbi:hypothetical protein Y032_0068g220 [Ancylostoma ceylanicum]|uniref:BPTI/Kunitz inhibitor domain-containing protein n=1 Tax=Ancylostoma ceylanicum TaxID=53326 RepID=A0A016U029_9BILA|nr:hypothetical protein Y032_0068g220 [Ancylostoma ceylanicum]
MHFNMKALALLVLWAATGNSFSANALPDICKEEIKTGNCRASFLKYGYDRCTNKCIPYTYGGCDGSRNMFDTLEECQEKCSKPEDRCSKQLERGICLASMKRYGYDTSSKKCKSFIYGGCGGNDNNFETLAECRETCKDNSSEDESIPDACLLPSEVGPCKGKQNRFYFDQKANTCMPFVFGGCGGNGNNFVTEAKCLETCTKPSAPEENEDICSLPIKAGPCKAMLKRFAYDENKKKCVEFSYGGCQGNKNNFESMKDCTFKCEQRQPKPEPEAKCSKPIETGPCNAKIKRFAYDTKKEKCVEFYYGGCKGNENNFETMEDCTWTCEQRQAKPEPEKGPCSQPIKVGPCNAMMKRFAYDNKKGKCVEFYYGGCKGNQNNFQSMEDCTWTCEQRLARPYALQNECSQPIEAGPCNAKIKRYAYDNDKEKCVEFYYGGCKGNENNFETMEDCTFKCEERQPKPEPEEVKCSQPIEAGPCNAKIKRFAYDNKKGKCVEFYYGGCKGNENNFETMEDCTWTCEQRLPTPDPEQVKCSQPIEAGPCNARIIRFAYDNRRGKCVEFTYGGCKGNENNFETMEDCTWTCEQRKPDPEPEQDLCSQPITAGPCMAAIPRYGYDSRRGKCVKFLYGGCRGNDNRFLTRSECEQTCMGGATDPEVEGGE